MFGEQQLDKTMPMPLYYQLKTLILKEIQKGAYTGNIPLPPEEKIAAKYGISRTTVRQAINELVKEGWLYRVKAKGTFVVDQLQRFCIAEHPEKYGISVRWHGKQIEMELIDYSAMVSANNMHASQVGSVRHSSERIVKRIRCDGRPAAILIIYRTREDEIYPVIQRVRHILRTTETGREDMERLDLGKSEPVLEVISTGFNRQGYVVEYSISRYCGSMCKVEVTDMDNCNDAFF